MLLVECNFVKLAALVYQIKKVLGKVQVRDDFVQVLNLPFVSFWSMFVWASNKSCPPLTPILLLNFITKFVSVCLDLKSWPCNGSSNCIFCRQETWMETPPALVIQLIKGMGVLKSVRWWYINLTNCLRVKEQPKQEHFCLQSVSQLLPLTFLLARGKLLGIFWPSQ